MTVKVLSGKCRGDYDNFFNYFNVGDILFVDVFIKHRFSINRSFAGSRFLVSHSGSDSNHSNGNWFGIMLHDYFNSDWNRMYESRIQIIDTGYLVG